MWVHHIRQKRKYSRCIFTFVLKMQFQLFKKIPGFPEPYILLKIVLPQTHNFKGTLMIFHLLTDCTICEINLRLCGITWCLFSFCYLLSVIVCFRWSGYNSRWWRGGSRGITNQPRPSLCQAPPTATRPRTTYSTMTLNGAVCGTLWVHCILMSENLSLFAC